MTKFQWNIGVLPFIWKPLSSPTNGVGIPDTLPFKLYMNKKTGLLMQEPNFLTSSTLSKVYTKGSTMTGMMDNFGIGKSYADDFLAFLHKTINIYQLNGFNVLEIGCGTGYLLSRLKQLGAECIGLEPGKHSQIGAEQYGIQIINDFFPSERIKETYDIILFYTVLEHFEDPFDFLIQVKSYLKPGGQILLGVPDCEPYMDAGDISFLIHEHWNYFKESTLRNTLISAGAYDIHIEKSKFGGALYASAKFISNFSQTEANDILTELNTLQLFKKRFKNREKGLISFINQIKDESKTLAIYVPSRAVNALTIGEADLSHCRFFDDNSLLHGTYFPGINIPIESRQRLIDNPTDAVLVMSFSFGHIIAYELKALLPARIIIKTWSDFF